MSTAVSPIQVKLSQEKLYFVAPEDQSASQTPIAENTLTIQNLMSGANESILYKVLSTVRQRYGVSHSMGVIGPLGTVELIVTLDLRMWSQASPSQTSAPLPSQVGIPERGPASPLPSRKKDDQLHFFFAVVPQDMATKDPGAVEAFWKSPGITKGSGVQEGKVKHICIPCSFCSLEELPPFVRVRSSRPKKGILGSQNRVRRSRSVQFSAPESPLFKQDTSLGTAAVRPQKKWWKEIYQVRVPFFMALGFLIAAFFCGLWESGLYESFARGVEKP